MCVCVANLELDAGGAAGGGGVTGGLLVRVGDKVSGESLPICFRRRLGAANFPRPWPSPSPSPRTVSFPYCWMLAPLTRHGKSRSRLPSQLDPAYGVQCRARRCSTLLTVSNAGQGDAQPCLWCPIQGKATHPLPFGCHGDTMPLWRTPQGIFIVRLDSLR